MRRIVLTGILFTLYFNCVGLEKKAKAKFPESILILGENTDKENNFSELQESLNYSSPGKCREEKESSSNYLNCQKGSEVLLQDFSEISGSLKEIEKNIWQIQDQAEIMILAKEYNDVKKQELSGDLQKTNELLKTSNKLLKSKKIRMMQEEIEKKINTPDYLADSAISILEKFDYPNEEAAVFKLNEAIEKKPDIINQDTLKKRVSTIFEKIKGQLSCDIQINEPNTEVFANTGFDELLKGKINCQNLDKKLKYRLILTSSGALRFGIVGSTEYEIIFSENTKFEFPVSALGMTRELNKIAFSIITFHKETIAVLEKFGYKTEFVVNIMPNEYTIQKLPASYTPEYAETMSRFFQERPFQTVKGKEMEAKISSNGQFTFGSEKKGVPMDTLFGHPNGAYADGIWSSVVSVKVDEEVYRFHELNIIDSKVTPDGKESVTTASIPGKNIDVYIKIRAMEGTSESLRLSLGSVNNSNVTHQVGFRVMLDTWAGNNDGVPFTIPGATEKEEYIYTKELKFNPASSPVWETYDIAHNGTVFIRNNLVGPGLNPPDEVAFISWWRGFFSEWEIDVNSDYTITGDSAIAQWWKPRNLTSGKKFEVTTEFANIIRKSGVYFEMIDKEAGFGYLIVQRDKEESSETEISYEIQTENGEAIFSSGKNDIKFIISPNVYFLRMIPINIISTSQNAKLKVKENYKGSITQLNFDIPLPSTKERMIASPIWNSGKKYPITFISPKGDLNLFGRIISKNNGVIIGEVKMVPGKSGETFIYKCEIELANSFEGNVDVVVVEK